MRTVMMAALVNPATVSVRVEWRDGQRLVERDRGRER